MYLINTYYMTLSQVSRYCGTIFIRSWDTGNEVTADKCEVTAQGTIPIVGNSLK